MDFTNKKYIFQIGFNKTGTTAIHQFLLDNGINSIHWDNGTLASQMIENFVKGKEMMSGYETYDAFTDMESLERGHFPYKTLFKELSVQYPNSLFILNTRDLDDWIESRMEHPGYLQATMKLKNLPMKDVPQYWEQEYKSHIFNVQQFFRSNHIENRLCEINMDNPLSSNYLANFLHDWGFKIKEYGFKRKNVTKSHLAYLINLKRREDRLLSFTLLAKQRGIEFKRIEAIDGKNINTVKPYDKCSGDLACRSSHALAWMHIATGSEEFGIIIEDDIRINSFHDYSYMVEEAKKLRDLELLFLVNDKGSGKDKRGWSTQDKHMSTHCYALHKTTAKFLLEQYIHHPTPIDNYISVDRPIEYYGKKRKIVCYFQGQIDTSQTWDGGSDNQWLTPWGIDKESCIVKNSFDF